jgi:hypothetical protein
MRRRARTDLSGGRSVMSVPTGSTISEQAANGDPIFQRADAGDAPHALAYRPAGGRFVYH